MDMTDLIMLFGACVGLWMVAVAIRHYLTNKRVVKEGKLQLKNIIESNHK